MTEHIGFKKLEHRIEREYEKKGLSKNTAELYAKETAAKVYREQHGLYGHPLHNMHEHNGRVRVLHKV